LSETGGFPFIEMEYIDGPDLGELLKEPHDPIYTIKETIKLADHLSHALAHCHRLDVKHGDIKSNNVKYNLRSGNYVLLDFGLGYTFRRGKKDLPPSCGGHRIYGAGTE
jgi:serine/threonine protein kinase